MNTEESDFSPIWVAGFMSGTSIDAVDAALILTDGEQVFDFGPVFERKYTPEERDTLMSATLAAQVWNWSGPQPEIEFGKARRVITRTHHDAFEGLLSQVKPEQRPVLAGVHGQTVLHRAPKKGKSGHTLQLIDAHALQAELGISFAYDFRSADVAAGGQGAPLAPIYHKALALNLDGSTAVLNLGGVANLTFLRNEAELLGFDCGPANGPIDEWVVGHNRGHYDVDGKFADQGSTHEGLLASWLDHPFFGEAPPKSLDRFDFNANLARGLSFEDGCATLTAFSAAAVALGLQLSPHPIERLIVCGGGRRNPALMRELQARCPCVVETAETVGWRGDSIEAEAFALLAARTLRDLPISFPGTTGVPHPLPGGRLLKR